MQDLPTNVALQNFQHKHHNEKMSKVFFIAFEFLSHHTQIKYLFYLSRDKVMHS
jgi:hypothetical protein